MPLRHCSISRLAPAWFELGIELKDAGARGRLTDLVGLLAGPIRRRGDRWWLVSSGDDALTLDELDRARAAFAVPVLGLAMHGKLSTAAQTELFGWSGLAGFEALDLSDTYLERAGLARLAACPHLGGIVELNLAATDGGAAGLRSLAASDALPALHTLLLDAGDHDKSRWNDAALVALINGKGSSLRGVRSLSLQGWTLRRDGLRKLAASELGHNLRHLSLASQSTLGEGARELLHALGEAGARLEALDLSWVFANYPDGSEDWNHHDGEPVAPLPALHTLILDECHFNAARVEALVDAWFWPQLRTLSLGGWHDLAPLARAPAGLRRLTLRRNRELDDRAMIELASWPVIAGLEHLDVRETKVSAEGLAQLPASLRAIAVRD